MTGPLAAMGPPGTALALLVLGHVLGDFAFQTRRMVERKGELGPTARHALVVTLAHVLALVPFLTPATLGILVLVGLSHLGVDLLKGRARDPDDPSLSLFLADQAAHLAVLVLAWALIPASALVASPFVEAVGPALPPGAASATTFGALALAALVVNHHGGNAVVRAVLPSPAPAAARDDELEAGRRIGTLERWLVLVLVLVQQWGAIAIVFAAKSIARFEELKDRGFAEHYLVGTLASVLVAVATGLAVLLLA